MKLALLQVIFTLTLFKMGIFGAAHGWGGAKRPPSLKSVTHPAMMKLGTVIPYLNKIQKIYESCNAPPEFSADINIYSLEISKFCYIKKCRYRFHFGT